MARIRTLKPDIWEDEFFGGLRPQVQLLMIGLITQADDEGYLRGNPAYVRSAVFPYADVSLEAVQEWLDELQCGGRIVQYGTDSQRYIHIRNFLKHQRVDKPRKSVFPKPHAALPTRPADEHFFGAEMPSHAGDSVIGLGVVLEASRQEGIGGDRNGRDIPAAARDASMREAHPQQQDSEDTAEAVMQAAAEVFGALFNGGGSHRARQFLDVQRQAQAFSVAEILDAVNEMARQSAEGESVIRNPKVVFPQVVRRIREGNLDVKPGGFNANAEAHRIAALIAAQDEDDSNV